MAFDTGASYLEFEEGSKGSPFDYDTGDLSQNDHDKAVLNFLQCYSEDLTRSLPIGSMIERLHAREVITLNERTAFEKKRDVGQATDEEIATHILSLMKSSAKTAEQRVSFLRVVEETRVAGLSKAILRGIWTLLQDQKAQPSYGNLYESLGARPSVMQYQQPHATLHQSDGKIVIPSLRERE